MLILAIQSSLPVIEIALLNDGKLLYQKSWPSNRDEIVKLLPAIEQGVVQVGYKFSDIKKIIITNGPGGFSSTRIGVTVANSLAYSLKAEIYELDMPTYERLGSAIQEKNLERFKEMDASLGRDNLKREKTSEKEISFAQIILKYLELKPQTVSQAIPRYATEAKITPSKKPKFV